MCDENYSRMTTGVRNSPILGIAKTEDTIDEPNADRSRLHTKLINVQCKGDLKSLSMPEVEKQLGSSSDASVKPRPRNA